MKFLKLVHFPFKGVRAAARPRGSASRDRDPAHDLLQASASRQGSHIQTRQSYAGQQNFYVLFIDSWREYKIS